jgi:hypothetical protein
MKAGDHGSQAHQLITPQQLGRREQHSAIESEVTPSPARMIEQYEQMIQQLEGEVRTHIRTEQQLKLHIESLQ